MKRFWPELAVILLSLTAFACLSFADGRSCGGANCQAAAKPMPKGPVPFVATPQTAEPPLAAGPVRTLVAVAWQKARVVVSFVLHPLSHRRHR